jgi:hypothetical protein
MADKFGRQLVDGGEKKFCPFCGADYLQVLDDKIVCLQCYAEGPSADSAKEAWEKWNHRFADDLKQHESSR